MSKKKVLVLLVLALVLVLTACEEDISSTNESYTLQAEVLEGKGAIELEPDKDSYESGAEVEVKAKAETGYEFKSWSNALSGEENPSEIIIDDDLIIGAKFNLKETVDKVETIGSGVGTVVATENEEGEKVYLAKAEEGSYFVGWKDDSNVTEVDLDNGQGYLLPEDDHIAIFAEIKGNFAIDSDYENGKVELDPAKEEYKNGDEVTIQAKADGGYSFTGWQGDVDQLDEEGIKNPKLTLVIGEDIAEDEVIGLYPNFARQAGELTLDKKGEGEIKLITEQDEYKVGDKVELIAEADEAKGYYFKQWSGDIGDIDKEEKEIEVEIKEDMNITAEFEIETYYLVVAAEHGEVTINPQKEEYEHGSRVDLKVAANHGWIFDDWCNNTTAVLVNNFAREDDEIRIKVEEDLELEARFLRDKFEVDVKIEGEGSVTGAGSYEYGAKVVLEAKPDVVWEFVRWGGDVSGNDKTLIIESLEEDMDIETKFEKKTYEVVVDQIGSGLVNGAGNYEYGKYIRLDAKPDKGWKFVGWGGDVRGNEKRIQIELLEEDMNIKAKFAPEGMVLAEAGTSSDYTVIDKLSGGTKTLDDITIENDFYIGKYHITQAEFKEVMGFNPSYFNDDNHPNLTGNNDNRPVEMITWYDALMYCNKASEAEGLDKYYDIRRIEYLGDDADDWGHPQNIIYAVVEDNEEANGYRLATKDEHEYAARGGKDGNATTYAGSDNINEVGWYDDNSDAANSIRDDNGGTMPVGMKDSNELGLYDMNGNVQDWTNTRSGFSHILRGGSWFNRSSSCDISYINKQYQDHRDPDIGFRLTRRP